MVRMSMFLSTNGEVMTLGAAPFDHRGRCSTHSASLANCRIFQKLDLNADIDVNLLLPEAKTTVYVQVNRIRNLCVATE